MSAPDMTQKIEASADDLAQLLTATSDILNGYGVRDLSSGWKQSAARLAVALRAAGHDDEGTWNTFTGETDSDEDDDAYDESGNLRAGDH